MGIVGHPFWRVDPSGDGQLGGLRAVTLESIWVSSESNVQRIGAQLEQRFCMSMVNRIRRHQSDTGVTVVIVIPTKELLAVCLGIFNAAETVWKVRAIFERLEMRVEERVVVRNIRPAVRF